MYNLKLLSVFTVFVQIAFFGYLPYIWNNIGQSKRVMSIVGCFAGGLFLALAFLHILPEANEQLLEYFTKKPLKGKKQKAHQAHQHHHQIPWGSLIAIITFVGVLTIESLVHRYLNQKQMKENKKKKDEEVQTNESNSTSNLEIQSGGSGSHLSSASSSVLLTQLALSIHSFIECLALGSQTTSKATITLLIGIGCHKWAQGLTLGFEYKRANFNPKLAFKFCLFHAILNAGAVLLGWIFSQSGQLLSGILGAISAGTFLYVSTVQKVESQFADSERIGQKIASMLVGVGFVCLIV